MAKADGKGSRTARAFLAMGAGNDTSELVIWNRSSLHIDERPKKLKDSADGKGICAGPIGPSLVKPEDTADIRPRTLDSRD
jgi:hypothetical protein